MMKNRKRVSFDRILMVMIMTIVMIVGLSAAFDYYYDLNDDTVIKDIISGTYTGKPSGYSVQMLYPLSWLIALCYRAISGVAWYGLFLCLCQFGAFALIAWRITELVEKKEWQIGVVLVIGVLYAGVLARELVIIQYSVTSGICMATAIFLYLTARPCENAKEALKVNGVAIVLVVLSYMMRTEMCFMLFPFLLLAGLSKWSEEKSFFAPKTVGKYISVIGVALLSMGIATGIDTLAYRQEGWSEYRAFFDARTKLYDFYGIPAYEGNETFYESIGLSREAYLLLENYNFALDENIDADLLEEIVAYQEKMAKSGENNLHVTGGVLITKNTIQEGIWLYKQHLLQMADGLWGYLIVTGYLLCAFFAMKKLKSGLIWKMLLLVVIRSVLWIYLLMVDRMVARITVPLLLGEVCVLFGLLASAYRRYEKEKEANKQETQQWLQNVFDFGVWLLLAVCGIAACASNLPKAYEEYTARERGNTRWETLLAYTKQHAEQFYVVDVYSSTSYQGVPYAEKLFENVDYSYRNWDLCGGWLVKSPLTLEKYAASEFEQIEDALLWENQEQVYFVAGCDKDISWLCDYYESKGSRVKPVCTDVIYDLEEEIFSVYALQKQ